MLINVFLFLSLVKAIFRIWSILLEIPLTAFSPISPREIDISARNFTQALLRLMSKQQPSLKIFLKCNREIFGEKEKREIPHIYPIFHLFNVKLSQMMSFNDIIL